MDYSTSHICFSLSENANNQRYILETVTMTSVTEQRILREMEDDERKVNTPSPSLPVGGSPISGILKGGRLWKPQTLEANGAKCLEAAQVSRWFFFVKLLPHDKNPYKTYVKEAFSSQCKFLISKIGCRRMHL